MMYREGYTVILLCRKLTVLARRKCPPARRHIRPVISFFFPLLLLLVFSVPFFYGENLNGRRPHHHLDTR